MIKRSRPPLQNILQRTQDKRGRELYKDTSSYNLQDGYFFADNANRRLRSIQPGRGYNFSGTQYMTFNLLSYTLYQLRVNVTIDNANCTSRGDLFDIYQTTSSWLIGSWIDTSTTRLSVYWWNGSILDSQSFSSEDWSGYHELEYLLDAENGTFQFWDNGVLRINSTFTANPSGWTINNAVSSIGYRRSTSTQYYVGYMYNFELYVNGSIWTKRNMDEGTGIISYDSSGNNKGSTIVIGGSSESAFHITSNATSSRANEIGYNPYKEINPNVDAHNDGMTSTLLGDGYYRIQGVNAPHISPFGIGKIGTGSAGIFRYWEGKTVKIKFTIRNNVGAVPYRYNFAYRDIWGQVGVSDFITKSFPDGAYELSININDPFSKITAGTTYSDGYLQLQTAGTVDLEVGDIEYWIDDLKIPINESIPTEDVLGNTVPANYQGQVRYETQVKGSSVGNFDGVLYGEIPYNASLSVDEFEWNIDYYQAERITYQDLLVVNYELNKGFRLAIYRSTDSPTYDVRIKIGSSGWISTGLSSLANSNHTINVKYYGGNVYVDLDGNTFTTAISQSNYYSTTYGSTIGAVGPVSFVNIFKGTIRNIVGHELDISGNRVNELISLQFSETNGLVVHNIAANKPANSNMAWVLGGSADGTQWGTSDLQRPKNLIEGFNKDGNTFIPADPSNPTLDILGNALTYQGDGKSILPSENVFDRNFADAPELVLSGIAQAEDIGYEDITGDISRFYDDNGDSVNELLNYSDFVEPIAGGAYNFSGVEKIDVSGVLSSPTTLDVELDVSFNSISANRFLFDTWGGSGASDRVLFAYNESNNALGLYVGGAWYFFSFIPAINTLYTLRFTYNSSTGDADLYINGLFSESISTASITIGYSVTVLGLSVTDSNGHNGKIYYARINDSIYNCEEGSGLVAYDASGDGNHGTIVLGGSSESSFHLVKVDKQNHHNLKYGYSLAKPFDDISNVVVINHGDEDIFKPVTVYASVPKNTQVALSNYLFDSNTNTRMGAARTATDSYAIIGSTSFLVNDGSEVIANIDLTGVAGDKFWIGGKNNDNILNIHYDPIYRFIVFKETLTEQGVRDKLALNDLSNAYELIGGDIKVPADPNNSGFDINGNPISNQAEVTKYNRITNYLKR